MTEAAKHTPRLPLSVGSAHGYGQLNGCQIKDERGLVAAVTIGDVPELAPEELAEFIVRAVNTFEAQERLIETLTAALVSIRGALTLREDLLEIQAAAFRIIDTALAQARKEQP